MKIKVTEEIIRESSALLKRGDRRSRSCPVALAIRKATGKLCGVSINGGDFIDSNDHDAGAFRLPVEANDFIRTFDGVSAYDDPLEYVDPFEFELEV